MYEDGGIIIVIIIIIIIIIIIDLKQENRVIIQFKHFCLLDFFLRIWKLKYIKQ